MKKLSLCFVFALVFLSLSSAFYTAQAQVATTNYTAPADPTPPKTPTLAAQIRAGQAPLSSTRSAAEWNAVRLVRLNHLSATEQQRTQEKKNFRIGIARPLPQQIESLSAFTAQPTPGGTLYLLRLSSPEAQALRVHFKALHLPTGARLFVFSRQTPQQFSPAYTGTQTDVWTPSLPGDEVILECFVPNRTTIETAVAPLQIDAVNHIFGTPRARRSAQSENAGACNQEVPTEFREAAKATALIAFVKPDGEYVCTGTLLADIKKTGTPYFLTAGHCISNAGEATSAEVYWNYDSGPEPTTAPTRSARLLVTDQAEDYTLLELGAKPPSGVVYSGWTSVPQATGTAVTGIHHPQADYKRAAFGKLTDASCPAEVPAEFCDFYAKVRWDRGITEPGSSGSGIFIGTGNQTQLIGLLSGGESSCETPGGIDYYGRLSRVFGALGFYLTNGEICRYTLLQDRFAYGQAGGNGEFTVVPKLGGENCPWQARTNVPWITFTNASGNGLGKVTFQVAANTSNQPRLGAISLVGRNVLVVQNPTAAPDDPCALTKIVPEQVVAGDLNATTCRSWFDSTTPALRYSFEGEPAQTLTLNVRQFNPYVQYHLISPDGVMKRFRDANGIGLTATGTYILEISLLPVGMRVAGTFSFSLNKSCTYKLSPNYFEVDGFGRLLNGTGGPIRVNADVVGSNCAYLFARADEPGIDDNKLHAAYNPTEKAVFISVNAATDPQPGFIVIRIADQPIIVRQTPRCGSATTLTYASEANVPGSGGQFQMQLKRTAGPVCSWVLQTEQVFPNGLTSEIRFLPDNTWQIRGTGDATIEYKVPFNDSPFTKQFVIKNNEQPVQTFNQSTLRATCTPTPIEVGQTINGELTTSDCRWRTAGEYADVYQLNVVPGEQFATELTLTSGTLLVADIAILDVGFIASPQVFDRWRWPGTGFYTANLSGKYLLFVYAPPSSYRLKVSGIGPPGCAYKVDKEGDNIFVPADATSASVQIECNRSDCDWTAQSSANWVTFPNGASGKGSQTLTMSLAPNTGVIRGATITVAGRSFYITQDYPCSYRQFFASIYGSFFVSYAGGEYNYGINTGASCPPLPITSNADWIKATISNRTITLKLDANNGGFRRGIVKIDGKDYEVQQGGNDLIVTTAADYQRTAAPGSLVTLFHQGLTLGTESARSVPLPHSLAGTSLYLRPANSVSYIGSLLYASPTQINFFIPEHIPPGRTKIWVETNAVRIGGNPSNVYAIGEFDIVSLAPNVFTADSSGKGPAAANLQRIRPGQPDVYEPVATATVDEQGKPLFVARPLTIGTGTEKTYLVLYATGLRKRNVNAAVMAQIGDVTVPVEYAGPQGQFVGLDQINILLPSSLRGKGLVNVTVTIDGKTTNPVQIYLAP